MDVGLDQGAVMLFGARLCVVCILGVGLCIVTGVNGFIVLVRIGDVCHLLFSDVAGFLACFVPAVLLLALVSAWRW